MVISERSLVINIHEEITNNYVRSYQLMQEIKQNYIDHTVCILFHWRIDYINNIRICMYASRISKHIIYI
jgi:hypothetical protein